MSKIFGMLGLIGAFLLLCIFAPLVACGWCDFGREEGKG